jgi:hypothetical protein
MLRGSSLLPADHQPVIFNASPRSSRNKALCTRMPHRAFKIPRGQFAFVTSKRHPPTMLPALTRRNVLASLALSSLSAAAYSRLLEPQSLRVRKVSIPLANLPPPLDGLRIVQLSDFHCEPFTPLPFLARAAEAASNLQPDLVALTGDFIDSRPSAIEDLAPVLSKINSRFGTFAINGNHDVRKAGSLVEKHLVQNGIQFLRNRSQTVSIHDHPLHLAGTDSLFGKLDLHQTLKNIPPEAFTILLAHEPDIADLASASGKVALQLSGHSHGGQIRIPGLPAPYLPVGGKKYPRGLYRLANTALFTSIGLGTTQFPLRFGCPPEVVEITLTCNAKRPNE